MKLPAWIIEKLKIHHKSSYKRGIEKLRQIRNTMAEEDKKEVAFPSFEDEPDEKLSRRGKYIAIMVIVAILILTILLAYWFGIEQGGLLLKDF